MHKKKAKKGFLRVNPYYYELVSASKINEIIKNAEHDAMVNEALEGRGFRARFGTRLIALGEFIAGKNKETTQTLKQKKVQGV